jgi:HIV-1 Vpr-binding protein
LFFLAATIDVKKNIYDLSCNKFDTQIAVVENQGMFDSVQESSVRLYDVGRRRDDEDEGVSWNYILFHNQNFAW